VKLVPTAVEAGTKSWNSDYVDVNLVVRKCSL
jgi:hypothetical protein